MTTSWFAVLDAVGTSEIAVIWSDPSGPFCLAKLGIQNDDQGLWLVNILIGVEVGIVC